MNYVDIFISYILKYVERISPEVLKKHMRDFYIFYNGFPEKGYYTRSLDNARRVGRSLLTSVTGSYVIFDLDDTLLYLRLFDPYPGPIYPGIPQIIDLFYLSKKLNFKTIIVTSRNSKIREETIENCKLYGIMPDGIYMRPSDGNIFFKKEFREKLKHINPDELVYKYPTSDDVLNSKDSKTTYPIALTIGDQWTDISGELNAIKLPEPHDMNTYIVVDGDKQIIV